MVTLRPIPKALNKVSIDPSTIVSVHMVTSLRPLQRINSRGINSALHPRSNYCDKC